MSFQEWITQNVPQNPDEIWNTCREYSRTMAEQFPDLKLVRGHVVITGGYERRHWWLVDQNGKVVDPTAHQFHGSYYGSATEIIEYREHDESGPEPTGKCPNCGGYCYNHRDLCSEKCEREYAAYVMSV